MWVIGVGCLGIGAGVSNVSLGLVLFPTSAFFVNYVLSPWLQRLPTRLLVVFGRNPQ